jgi:hypothetical protein
MSDERNLAAEQMDFQIKAERARLALDIIKIDIEMIHSDELRAVLRSALGLEEG